MVGVEGYSGVMGFTAPHPSPSANEISVGLKPEPSLENERWETAAEGPKGELKGSVVVGFPAKCWNKDFHQMAEVAIQHLHVGRQEDPKEAQSGIWDSSWGTATPGDLARSR